MNATFPFRRRAFWECFEREVQEVVEKLQCQNLNSKFKPVGSKTSLKQDNLVERYYNKIILQEIEKQFESVMQKKRVCYASKHAFFVDIILE